MSLSDYRRHLLIAAADYGQDFPWVVEWCGRPVARLTDPLWEDMFWYSYRIAPLGTNSDEQSQVLTPAFWAPENEQWRSYISAEFEERPPFAFPGSFVPPDRVMMRGLYLP